MEGQPNFMKFVDIIVQLFKLLNYSVEQERPNGPDTGIDLIVEKNRIKHFVQIKFYKSSSISSPTLKHAANDFAYSLTNKRGGAAILVVNALVPLFIKNEILHEYGVTIWDKEIIYSYLTKHSIELREEFEKLLLNNQQGNDVDNVFKGIRVEYNPPIEVDLEFIVKPKFKNHPLKKGRQLCDKLRQVPCGKDGWVQYENVCFEIILFLFEEDLALWEKQSRTDDGLSRFDLICRIASRDSYWKALVSSFNTRFVLFEFKNYCDEIDQGQIYTTERYLFNKALRSVGFILSRKGGNSNAILAAKGALKEHGKLILMLSDQDLCKMLKMKDNNEIPNDYLSSLLDKWLISLSR